METNKISTKQNLQLKDATAYLEALLASFKAGKIVVEKDGEFLTMVPAENIVIEISAKTKKGKGKFSMELSWAESDGRPLTISDKEPESAEKAVEEENKTADVAVEPEPSKPFGKAEMSASVDKNKAPESSANKKEIRKSAVKTPSGKSASKTK